MRRLALMTVSVMAAMCTAPSAGLAADTILPVDPPAVIPSATLPTVQIVVGRSVLGSHAITELTRDLAAGGSATVIMTGPVVDRLRSVGDSQLRELAAASRAGSLIVPGGSGLLSRTLKTHGGRVATYDSVRDLTADLGATSVTLSAPALAGLLQPAAQRIGGGHPRSPASRASRPRTPLAAGQAPEQAGQGG